MPGRGFPRNGVKHFLVRVLSTFGLSDYIFQRIESRFVATQQDTGPNSVVRVAQQEQSD